MADSERPNWVPERARCNTSVLLEALAQIIEKDVEQTNETLGLEDNPFTRELDRGVVEVKRPSFRRPLLFGPNNYAHAIPKFAPFSATGPKYRCILGIS